MDCRIPCTSIYPVLLLRPIIVYNIYRTATDHDFASVCPAFTFTRKRTGTGITSRTKRKRKPSRMFPVRSAIRPTTKGPRKDADLSVSANSEKKDDSWLCCQEIRRVSAHRWDELSIHSPRIAVERPVELVSVAYILISPLTTYQAEPCRGDVHLAL